MPVAKQLLVSGFLNEVVDRLDHPAITGFIHGLIEESSRGAKQLVIPRLAKRAEGPRKWSSRYRETSGVFIRLRAGFRVSADLDCEVPRRLRGSG